MIYDKDYSKTFLLKIVRKNKSTEIQIFTL